jgi:hypothetical protein
MATDFNAPVFQQAWQLLANAYPNSQDAAPAVGALFNENSVPAEDRKNFISEYNRAQDPFPSIPDVFKEEGAFVSWSGNAHDKQPFVCGTNRPASYTDPNDWCDYDTAVRFVLKKAGKPRLGLVIRNGYVGLDLDSCRNLQTGVVSEWALKLSALVKRLKPEGTYTHVTTSGGGVRVWLRVPSLDGKIVTYKLPTAMGAVEGKAAQVEVLTTRYATLEGELYDDSPSTVAELSADEWAQVADYLSSIEVKKPRKGLNKSALGAFAPQPDEGFKRLFERIGWEPLIDRMDKMADGRFHNLSMDAGQMMYCPMPQHQPRGEHLHYSACFGALSDEPALAHCFGCDFSGDMVKAVFEFDKGEDGGHVQHKNMYECTRAICKEYGLDYYEFFPSQKPFEAPPQEPAQTQASRAEEASKDVTGSDDVEGDNIPSYNPTIECGFFKEVIDAVCNGTTIPRQFMHNVLKSFVGALASDRLKFDNIDCNSCRYAVNIGTSGTSKRTVWDRGIINIFGPMTTLQRGEFIKVFDSVDSGAGLRDAFFEAPKDAPIILMIDEAASLGNKSAETKNPEIVDTIIELADSTSISRVKSKKSMKVKAAKTHSNARLGMYVCAQTGEVVTQAFQGRGKQGINERLDIEYSPAIEPGDLPRISEAVKTDLRSKLLVLMGAHSNWQQPMSMGADAKEFLDAFWASQTLEIRQKIRLRKNLWLDVYMRTFSRSETVATLEDAQLCVEHFERDKRIREVHFQGEISDKVSMYVKRLKGIIAEMRRQMNKGLPVRVVALSKRDLQTKTHAFDDNDDVFFDRALNVVGKAHLWQVLVKASNGQTYTKFIPMPYEHETWEQLKEGKVSEFKGGSW